MVEMYLYEDMLRETYFALLYNVFKLWFRTAQEKSSARTHNQFSDSNLRKYRVITVVTSVFKSEFWLSIDYEYEH